MHGTSIAAGRVSFGRMRRLPGSQRTVLNQLDLVAVRVLHEGDDGAAPGDRAGLAGDLATGCLDACAGRGGIVHAQSDVAVGGAQVVVIDAVVVGQLEFGLRRVGLEAEKGQAVFLLGAVGGAQQLHADDLGVEIDGALQIADAQHGVEKTHEKSCEKDRAPKRSARSGDALAAA